MKDSAPVLFSNQTFELDTLFSFFPLCPRFNFVMV